MLWQFWTSLAELDGDGEELDCDYMLRCVEADSGMVEIYEGDEE